MGGMGGEARGKTKEECWDRFMIVDREATGYGLERSYPQNKQEAYREMKKDTETGEYVLKYRFDK